MPRRRYSTTSRRRSSYRRTARVTARRRTTTRRRRSTARVQRVVIQVVGAPSGVIASPSTLGSKTLRPLRARY